MNPVITICTEGLNEETTTLARDIASSLISEHGLLGVHSDLQTAAAEDRKCGKTYIGHKPQSWVKGITSSFYLTPVQESSRPTYGLTMIPKPNMTDAERTDFIGKACTAIITGHDSHCTRIAAARKHQLVNA